MPQDNLTDEKIKHLIELIERFYGSVDNVIGILEREVEREKLFDELGAYLEEQQQSYNPFLPASNYKLLHPIAFF